MNDAQLGILVFIVLLIGGLLGFGFFAIMWALLISANHKVMDERGVGRRPDKK